MLRICGSGVDRYAVSVLWEMTPSFDIIPEKTWFGRTLIRSAYALTYYQAQRLVDGQDADSVPSDVLVRRAMLCNRQRGTPFTNVASFCSLQMTSTVASVMLPC
jgi:hypothetical protein